MYEAFITGETAEIQRINDTIELLGDGDESYEDIFSKSLQACRQTIQEKNTH